MVHDRDDYEQSTNLRANAGVRIRREPFSGQINVSGVLDDGQRWDVSGDVRYAPSTGPYAGLTTRVSESRGIDTEQAHARIEVETGWKRAGLSPYMTLGPDTWKAGQKLKMTSHEVDMYVSNAQDDTQVRVAVKVNW